jgi:hypothetical protein
MRTVCPTTFVTWPSIFPQPHQRSQGRYTSQTSKCVTSSRAIRWFRRRGSRPSPAPEPLCDLCKFRGLQVLRSVSCFHTTLYFFNVYSHKNELIRILLTTHAIGGPSHNTSGSWGTGHVSRVCIRMYTQTTRSNTILKGRTDPPCCAKNHGSSQRGLACDQNCHSKARSVGDDHDDTNGNTVRRNTCERLSKNGVYPTM